jgi:hypothetical protein
MLDFVIILQTYARTEYALATVQALRANLRADNYGWYVADDGSNETHHAAVLEALTGEHIVGSHNERISYGATANKAWHVAHDHSDVTLWLEDDWTLSAPFDPAPYLSVLNTHDEIGMVRLAQLPIGLNCKTIGIDGRMYLQMFRDMQYAFSGNPSLRHRRFRETYGAYTERLSPGNTELAYDAQFRTKTGCEIVRPNELGDWGLFGHIGAVKSY